MTLYATIGDWSHYSGSDDWDYYIFESLNYAQETAREWDADPCCNLIQIVEITDPTAVGNEDWCLWDHLQSDTVRLLAEISR